MKLIRIDALLLLMKDYVPDAARDDPPSVWHPFRNASCRLSAQMVAVLGDDKADIQVGATFQALRVMQAPRDQIGIAHPRLACRLEPSIA
jgi:hypothetical protein